MPETVDIEDDSSVKGTDDDAAAQSHFTAAFGEADFPAAKVTAKTATNEGLGSEKLKVSLSNIPAIGYIDATFVEKYFDLFIASFFESQASKFLSPLRLAEIGTNLASKDSLELNNLHNCQLHFLPTLRHYVVTQVKNSQEEVCVVVYDSNHHGGHIQEMLEELKLQLNVLFEELPKIQICCPQTSLPYLNHALFALATFQVVALDGNPCEVRFSPEKIRDRLRLINEETSKANLLFPFTLSTVQKQNKRFPWLGKVVDFVQYESLSDEEPSNDGLFTTMLTQRHLVSDLEVNNAIKKREKKKKKGKEKETWDDILSLAPSEHQVPRNPFMDLHAEEMSYCGLFGGEPRSRPLKAVSYHKLSKWELRHKNRRFARHHENLFFKTRKSMIKLLSDLELVSLRKVVRKDGTKYTAKDLKQNREKLLHHDEGYRFLSTLRGSPAYFEKIKKNVFAMMRYHGKPTFFTTFSAAESQWTDLIKNLGKVVDQKEYTDKEINEMTRQEKQRLILADPVTCARHFNHRTHILFKEFFKSANSPFELQEFFYRVEFQKRGSPHLHCLLWVKDAPIFNKENATEVADYVDQFVSCSKYMNIPVLSLDEQEQLIARQTHHHTRTCPANNKVCRFNFPKPPMDKTTVLCPFEKSTKEKPLTPAQNQQLLKHKSDFKRIEETLNSWSEQPQNFKINSMDDFLVFLKLSYEDYINALRSSLHVETVFLKRYVDERWINGYNAKCLAVWKANMDCQYVVNGFAAASYILDYVTKGERGMSETLRAASKEAAIKNMTQKSSLKHISKRFIDFVETGAQEAAYYLLGIQLYNSSNAVVFIPTAEDSAKMCKPAAETANMEDDDENIFMLNCTDRYVERPRCLDGICLAEYVAWYDGLASYYKSAQKLDPDDDFAQEKEKEQVDEDEPADEGSTMNVQGLKKRKKARIIRYVNFNIDTHKEEHYRELLMLFSSYRDINTLRANCETYKERYQEVKNEVEKQRTIYSRFESELAGLEDFLNNNNNNEGNELMQNLAPGAEQLQSDGLALQQEVEANLPLPYRIPSSLLSKSYHLEDDWSENSYYNEVAKLNKKQYQLVNEFLFNLKRSHPGNQMLWFLSGGAGVGKTTAVNALYQGVRRHFNSLPNEDHSSLQIVKCAFTGKASHQVQGYTINTLFKMPFGAKKKREQLTGKKLAELQSKMANLKVLIIDEISMVDNEMWIDMSNRLCKIKDKDDLPFGGVHVLAVGDLFQLLPVRGRPVWEMHSLDSNSNILGYPLGYNVWKEEVKLFEFDEIMRQKDEKPWADFLNRLRESPLSEEDSLYIKEQLIDKDHDIIPDASYITLTNDRSDFFNDQWFMMSPSDQRFVLKSEDIHSAHAPISPNMILNNIETVSRGEVQNLAASLKLAIGQEYDFVINLDTADGLTNGTPCIAKKYQSVSIKGDIVWVDPQDQRVGRLWRQKHRILYDDGIPNHWLPVLRHGIACSSKHFTRRQFPLRASKSRTVNRTQGATLNRIVIDFSDKRGQTAHCHYVAFSRCPSKYNVAILGSDGLAESKIRHDSRCIQEMERLRLGARLELTLPLLFDLNNEYFNVYFLNAQSILGKIGALECDWNIRGSTVVGIVDTRFEHGKEKNMVCFNEPGIFYSSNARPSLGIAVYSSLVNNHSQHHILADGKGSMVSVRYTSLNVTICYVYILPEAPSLVYSDAMDRIRNLDHSGAALIILGDFNKNPELLPSSFKKGACELGLRQLITGMTHNRGNTLDHVYTNINDEFLRYGCLNTMTKSDHLPVFVSVKTSAFDI